jgi:hypothetical protein
MHSSGLLCTMIRYRYNGTLFSRTRPAMASVLYLQRRALLIPGNHHSTVGLASGTVAMLVKASRIDSPPRHEARDCVGVQCHRLCTDYM